MTVAVLDQISSDVERRMGPHGPEPAHDAPNAPHEDRARCVFRNLATEVERYLGIFQTGK